MRFLTRFGTNPRIGRSPERTVGPSSLRPSGAIGANRWCPRWRASTRSMMLAMCPSPLKESNHLWLLAEASLNFPSHGDAPSENKPNSKWTAKEALWSDESLEGTAIEGTSPDGAPAPAPPPRSASRADSSRSASPATGRSYICRKCHREYASTDAVRKHCRQNHAEWLREQGQGCPTLYSTVIDAPPATSDALVPHASTVATPPTLAIAAEDPESIDAAESFIAFSRATVAGGMPAAPPAAPAAVHAAHATFVTATPSPIGNWRPLEGVGAKRPRPRSVRCGKCDGCERDDCGVCKNCVDKPKFGGLGQRKQGCIAKICRAPRVAN